MRIAPGQDMANKVLVLLLIVSLWNCFDAAAQQRSPTPTQQGTLQGDPQSPRDPPQICVLNVGEALGKALVDHLRMSGFLLKEKALPDRQNFTSRAPLLTDPFEFQKHVRKDPFQVPGSSLVLYAEDQEYFCAFFWHANDEVIYVRTKNEDRYLQRTASSLNSNIIARVPESDRTGKSRASALVEVFKLASGGSAKI